MSVQAESEAEKMRRVPGIYFADSPSGRQAYIAGTGLGVFEIVRGLRDFDSDWEELHGAFHWLSKSMFADEDDRIPCHPASVVENKGHSGVGHPATQEYCAVLRVTLTL